MSLKVEQAAAALEELSTAERLELAKVIASPAAGELFAAMMVRAVSDGARLEDVNRVFVVATHRKFR